MITSIKFKAGELRRLLANAMLFACKDGTLPALCVVRFEWEADRLFAVATNRYIVSWEESWPVEAKGRDAFSVSVKDAKRIVALIPKACHAYQEVDVEYDTDAKHVHFTFEGSISKVSTDHGDFPRWRTMTEKFTYEARDGITFNAGHIALFAKVDCESKNVPVRFEFQTAALPARVTMGEHFSAMICPIRNAGLDLPPGTLAESALGVCLYLYLSMLSQDERS